MVLACCQSVLSGAVQSLRRSGAYAACSRLNPLHWKLEQNIRKCMPSAAECDGRVQKALVFKPLAPSNRILLLPSSNLLGYSGRDTTAISELLTVKRRAAYHQGWDAIWMHQTVCKSLLHVHSYRALAKRLDTESTPRCTENTVEWLLGISMCYMLMKSFFLLTNLGKFPEIQFQIPNVVACSRNPTT